MTQQTVATIEQVTFSVPEQQKLLELRNRYGDDRDIFTPQEKERIRFLRWLYQNGRIPS
jgi:hypothetical protein